MESLRYIIPNKALIDTVAILVVLLSLPAPLSFLVLGLFILTSSYRKFASKLFTKLFESTPHHQTITIPSSSSSTKDQSEHNQYLGPLLLVASLDSILCLVIKVSLPRATRYVFILADGIIASKLSGKGLWISTLATLSVSAFEQAASYLLVTLQGKSSAALWSTPELFPYLPKSTPPFITSILQNENIRGFELSFLDLNQIRLLDLGLEILNVFNLLLSIHIVIIELAPYLGYNLITQSINQLTSVDQDLYYAPFSPFLLNKEKEEKKIKLVEIELPDDISSSTLVLDNIDQTDDVDQAPASYPSSAKNNEDDLVSTSSIVQENFEVFCRSSFTKPKNSAKANQPLWSLIATMKAMTSRKDIYSGRVQIDNGDNNALVLSDSVSKYDVNELQNYEDGYRREKILIFIDYIGETLIGFQLQNFDRFNDVIVIRVNGLIWYQVLRGDYKGEQYFIVGGLTPLSQYDIQFLTEEVDENGQKKIVLIDDLIVSTVNSNGDDVSTNNNNNSSGKPLSPLTTLRGSLVTTNENLNKEKAKLKKTKKELSKKISTYKQDIEQLKFKIGNSDKNDEKNWKKVLSLRSSVNQVEEDISKIEEELSKVEIEESEVSEVYAVEKRKFDLASRNYQNFKNGFNARLSVKRDQLRDLSTEIETGLSKKEKLTNKFDKSQAEVERLETEINDMYQHELSLRLIQRKKRAEKRTALLNEFKIEIEKQESEVMRLQAENEQLKNEILT